MVDPKKELAAHNARATRAKRNIDRLLRLVTQNRAVLAAERVRANQVRKKIRGVSGRANTLRWALSRVGVVEHPSGSNSGPFISDWLRMSGGQPGWPWCQAFVNAGLFVGSDRKVQLKSCYTPEVVGWARNREQGLKLVSLAEAKPGDFVYFKFPNVSNDICDHVGLLFSKGAGEIGTIEGNTSAGNQGSQSNGGGVFRRTRSNSLVAFVVRPPYAGE